MSSFPQRFKYLRENVKHWTQDEVAELLGMSRSTVAGYESEQKNRVPREETLHKIADLFNCSVDYLLGRTDNFYRNDADNKKNEINLPPEEQEFLDWVRENLEGTFFYDFDKSPEDSKKYMMETLRMVWEREKGRKPGQKQGE